MRIEKGKGVVALILARGGSKEIPRKNLIDINGLPLISYVIAAAKNSLAYDVWVSTDDDEIGQIANSYGAKVIARPPEISQDNSKSEDALLHFSSIIDFNYLLFIQTTSPLVNSDDLDRGIELIQSNQFDSVFSVTPEHWTGRWNLDLTPDGWDPQLRPRRQDMPIKYIENGAFYITRRESLLQSRLRFSGRLGVVEMPLERSFQLDSVDDLSLLRKLLRN